MRYLLPEESFNISSRFEVLYFYATWMNFHKRFAKMISSYEEKNENYLFTAIDVDLNKDLCKRFEITSIPAIIILFKGKEVRRCDGMILTSAFKSALADIYNKYKEKK